jgi:hypothetical protein
MKGIVAKSLLAIFVLVSTVAAQENPYPVPDPSLLTFRAQSQLSYYPTTRDFNGGGARAKGMGNAFIGVADDATGVTWNPAGLYRQDDQFSQPVLGLGYRSISSDATSSDRIYPNVPWYNSSTSNIFNGVNFMSLVLPIRIKGHMFVGSAAYSRLGDDYRSTAMALDSMMYYTDEDFFNDHRRLFTYRALVEYRSWANAYNFGFGTRVYRQLSAGLSVNVYGGGASERYREAASWDSLIVPGITGDQRAYVQVLNEVNDTASYSGIYFTLGFKVNSDRWSGGLVIKTPHVLKQTIDYVTDHKITNNGFEVSGTTTRIHNDDRLVEVDQPMTLGLGVGFKARPNWLASADLEYRSFSGCKLNFRDSLELVPGGTNIEYFSEVDPQWRNTLAIRLGTEYVWTTGNALFPTVPLRAGLGWIQVPEPDVLSGGVGVDQNQHIVYNNIDAATASLVRWSLGTGVRWSQIHLDFSYESYSLDQENMALAREWSVDNSAFDITFTGYF